MTTTTSRVSKSGAIKLGFAALAAAALTIGGLTPAYAADVQLGPDDIAGFEIGGDGTAPGFNYDQWHVGSVYNSGLDSSASLEFGECSVTTLAVPENAESNSTVTQVLKGYSPGARPTVGSEDPIENVRALIESISIDVAEGSVTLQVPIFTYWDGDPEDPSFTTVRNSAAFGPGTHGLSGVELIESSDNDIYTNFDEIFELWASDIENYGDYFEILGVGFTGSEGAVVNSISFGGDTYYFGTGDCTPEVPVDPADPADPVTPVAPKKPVAVETGF